MSAPRFRRIAAAPTVRLLGQRHGGTTVPEISGNVVYADLCSGELWAARADRHGQAVRIATGVRQVTSFGVDAAGEVRMVAFGQPLRQIVRH